MSVNKRWSAPCMGASPHLVFLAVQLAVQTAAILPGV